MLTPCWWPVDRVPTGLITIIWLTDLKVRPQVTEKEDVDAKE